MRLEFLENRHTREKDDTCDDPKAIIRHTDIPKPFMINKRISVSFHDVIHRIDFE